MNFRAPSLRVFFQAEASEKSSAQRMAAVEAMRLERDGRAHGMKVPGGFLFEVRPFAEHILKVFPTWF